MTIDWQFRAGKLLDSLGEIKRRFLTPDEMAAEDRRAECEILIAEVSALNDDNIQAYAGQLKARGVENLIFAALHYAPDDMLPKLINILNRRMTGRIVTLIWSFYGCEYENARMAGLAAAAVKYINATGLTNNRARMLLAIPSQNPPASLANAVLENGESLNGFFRDYDVSRESPLAFAAAKEFFITCKKDGFILNEGWMIRVIQSKDRYAEVLNNYLALFGEDEFSGAINEAVLDAFGFPASASDWPGVEQKLITKFSRWCFLKELRLYYAYNRTKYNSLIRYLPYFRNVKKIAGPNDTEALSIEFAAFHVVDTDSEAGYAYMLTKRAYERMTGDGLDFSDMALYEAREYVLDETTPEDEEILRLNFHQVGKLFSNETLNIMLGITPDPRASRTIIGRKLIRAKADNLVWGENA